MKLKEMKTTPSLMGALQRYIAERAFNVDRLVKKGQGKFTKADGVLGDLVVLEAKLDGLMSLLEAQGIDMTSFMEHMEQACKEGQATAITIRKQFEKAGI